MDNKGGRESVVTGSFVIANSVAAGALAASFCTCAAAADLTGRPPPPLMPISSWSGFSVSGHVGGVTSGETDPSGFTAATDPSGLLGDLAVAVDIQVPEFKVRASNHFGAGSLFGHW
jgi:hypothetical protein